MKKLTQQEETEVNEIGKRITETMGRVADRIELLQHQRQGNIERIGLATLGAIQANRQQTHRNTEYLRKIDASLNELRLQSRDLQATNNVFFMIHPSMAEVMQTGLYRIVSEDQYIERLLNTDLHQYTSRMDRLTKYLSENHLWPDIEYTRRTRTPVQALSPMTREELLRHLQLPKDDTADMDDLKYVLRRSHAMGQRGLDQARSLMSKDAFKALLAKDQSTILMVDGHVKNEGAGKISPLSVWSASFAASLSQSDSIVALHFFCSLHSCSDSEDVNAGPLGLMRSILAQLIRQADISTWIRRPQILSQDNRVESISQLFKSLLTEIDPGKTIFLIIDNVSEFEGVTWNEWSNQIQHVFTSLYHLVHDDRGGQEARRRPKIKVLLTSANKSTVLRSLVAGEEIISLR